VSAAPFSVGVGGVPRAKLDALTHLCDLLWSSVDNHISRNQRLTLLACVLFLQEMTPRSSLTSKAR